MNNLSESIITSDGSGQKDLRSAEQTLRSMRSGNLHIALCGPIGVRLTHVEGFIKKVLKDAHYDIASVKVSDLARRTLERDHKEKYDRLAPKKPGCRYSQYRSKQKIGNSLRKHHKQNEILGVLVAQEISQQRVLKGHDAIAKSQKDSIPEVEDLSEQQSIKCSILAAQKRTAYIINQLKTPEEAKLLRKIYQGNFFMIATVDSEEHRLESLKTSESMSPSEAQKLMELDRKERTRYGQAVEATVLEADYVVRNVSNADKMGKDIKRFASLMLGKSNISPTREEYGMYQAFSASLGSLCLSRQVGASILDEDGNILATGRNDVPKFGGGLYETSSPYNDSEDSRCVNYEGKECHNERKKDRIGMEIGASIEHALRKDKKEKLKLSRRQKEVMRSAIHKSSLNDLLEFSRSVHAEMDAIVSLARKGVRLPRNSTLFTTTFPCHNCARHIVAAGITDVIFLEPYEKSKAVELHKDSIVIGERGDNRMRIKFFTGVSPRKYASFFMYREKRKEGGKAITKSLRELAPAEDLYVFSYIEMEALVVKNFQASL